MLPILLFLVLLPQVKGETKGLGLQWGRSSRCDKINLFQGITITECYKECLKRVYCRLFVYAVRSRNCELCKNDDAVTGVILNKSAGYVLSQKKNWKQRLQASSCHCLNTTICNSTGANASCKVDECEEPTLLNVRAKVEGNMRGSENRVTFTCQGSDLRDGKGRAACDPDGSWKLASSDLTCGVYMGCFEDSVERSLPDGPFFDFSAMTNKRCLAICKAHYGAVHTFYFASQFSYACTCGLNYPKYPKKPESECNVACAGDSTQICGAAWRMNVYQAFQ